MKAGRTKVFEGVTDASGRFVTTPLEPGLYTFELRIPKGFVSSARYFLALSGAKPVGDAMTSPAVPLMMQAQVRRLTSVRGQVTGRRVAVIPTIATTATGGTATTTTAGTTVATRVSATTPARTAGDVPAATVGARMSIGSRTIPARRTTAAPRSTGAVSATATPRTTTTPPAPRAMTAPRTAAAPPTNSGRAVATTRAATPTAAPATTTQGLAARPGNFEPRMINGRRHYWVPIAPGSTLGRWVPDRAGRPGATAAPAQSTAPRPSPSPSPRRR